MTPMTDMQMVVDALSGGDRFLVTSHENPDGDALGSLLAMHLALRAVGKNSVMVLAGESPIPGEYAFLDLESHGLVTGSWSPSTALRRAGSPTTGCSRRR